jgi:hypothetical protein
MRGSDVVHSSAVRASFFSLAIPSLSFPLSLPLPLSFPFTLSLFLSLSSLLYFFPFNTPPFPFLLPSPSTHTIPGPLAPSPLGTNSTLITTTADISLPLHRRCLFLLPLLPLRLVQQLLPLIWRLAYLIWRLAYLIWLDLTVI